MSVENVQKFLKRVAEDESLQAQVKAAEAAYAGDKDDREAAVEAVILPLASKVGLPFTLDDLKAVEAKASKDSELSDKELEAVAGGAANNNAWGLCIGLGIAFGEHCTVLGMGVCTVAGQDSGLDTPGSACGAYGELLK